MSPQATQNTAAKAVPWARVSGCQGTHAGVQKRQARHLCAVATEVEHKGVPCSCLADKALQVALDVGSCRGVCTAAIIHEHGDILRREAVALRQEGVHGLDIVYAPTQLGRGACTSSIGMLGYT